ncbi:MAG: DoxX-like family protein [Edaphobacter sp.]
MSKGLYVELEMKAGMEHLWQLTQDPALHQRWDLRFSTIRYLPKSDDAAPQQFLYETRIGFGIAIAGEGESTGTRSGAIGERTSALRFWSDDPKSLIRTGAGYWKYIPDEGGRIRFLTWYDYQTRFGAAGQCVDTLFLRPIMGWATAWSFDRLRLWIESDIPPEAVLRSSIIYGVCRIAVASIWIWHGFVPKLFFHDATELKMLADTGIPLHWLPLIGFVEVLFGLLGLFAWRWRSYFVMTGVAMIAALITVALRSPAQLTAAFNPVTLNLGVAALCACGWLAHYSSAFAGRCFRRPAESRKEVGHAVHL